MGCRLVKRQSDGGLLWGVVVETEAYSQDEPACHGYRRRSPQNETLFGEPGRFLLSVCAFRVVVLILTRLLVGKYWQTSWVFSILKCCYFRSILPDSIADIAHHGGRAINPECVLTRTVKIRLLPLNN